MSNDKRNFNMSGIISVLNKDDQESLVNALMHKITSLAGQHSFEVLTEIQNQHDELEAKFVEERAALEAKFRKLCQPLLTKCEILDGVLEVGVTKEVATEQEEYKAAQEYLEEEISKSDERALKYLRDIKWYRVDNPKGFKFEFFFDPNPYFKDIEDETVLEKAIGMDIECYLGKCLTQKLLKKKLKKGKPITKTDNHGKDTVKELQNQMEQLLCTLRATGKEKAPSSSESDDTRRSEKELVEAIEHASIVFADGLRDSFTQMGLAIREINEYQTRRDREIRDNQMRHDIELREKQKKLYKDLWDLPVGSFTNKFRAFHLIGQDNTLMNLFYSLPNGHKDLWVETLLSYDNKQYQQYQDGSSSMSQGNDKVSLFQ